MAEAIAISLENVSKVFKQYYHPVDRLKEILLPGKQKAREFWALRNIDLEIPKGRTWGIVGRNGAGKSTLLQIIAGTLRPTTGKLAVNGRVSALLELGSGFNSEFTGTQNVFFNGQTLGLSHQEIKERFDEIVAFADIGEFIHRPVKTYSSGMRARLAFAVSINVDPDILIVDEVLAVGDAAFQRKCFSRMERIREKGCTVLFVSHSTESILQLCDQAVLVDQGQCLMTADTKTVTSYYQKLIYASGREAVLVRRDIEEVKLSSKQKREPTKKQVKSVKDILQSDQKITKSKSSKGYLDPAFKSKSITEYISNGAIIQNPVITDEDGNEINILIPRETYTFSYEVFVSQRARKVRCGMLIKTISGVHLGGMTTHPLPDEGADNIHPGMQLKVNFRFNALLNPGVYFLNAGISGWVGQQRKHLHRILDAVIFRVDQKENLTTTGTVDFSHSLPGSIEIKNHRCSI